MSLQKLLGLIAVALVSACSTAPVTEQTAVPVPSERIYQPSYFGTASNVAGATVVFLRDSGLFGAGCSHNIYVDNIKVFSIRNGEQAVIHVPAGQHFYRLETGVGPCPNIATSQESSISGGAKQVYRILLPSDGSLRLTRVE
ncbi:hypothetical protein [Aquipseudomonas ullengensis]|uniref:Lipoprotein n=1 Tax=Aquipseudomonas ullengensis TaxID=2759166 RepID=A0A7W4LMU9_9GAMM|nr:hypothetical protein [Pseudomonas ullengensis]MBB2495952.1 hypothetical protein [Pseudomonas ullengensis]